MCWHCSQLTGLLGSVQNQVLDYMRVELMHCLSGCFAVTNALELSSLSFEVSAGQEPRSACAVDFLAPRTHVLYCQICYWKTLGRTQSIMMSVLLWLFKGWNEVFLTLIKTSHDKANAL